MMDRRIETRMLCADLLEVHWKDSAGHARRLLANLEDISLSGACIQVEKEIPLETSVRLMCPKGELTGIVRYCVYRDIGYFLGIEFDQGCKWSLHDFQPQHMLDPRRLMPHSNQ
jgi:PilZ domain